VGVELQDDLFADLLVEDEFAGVGFSVVVDEVDGAVLFVEVAVAFFAVGAGGAGEDHLEVDVLFDFVVVLPEILHQAVGVAVV
jgi:hypothetical protein